MTTADSPQPLPPTSVKPSRSRRRWWWLATLMLPVIVLGMVLATELGLKAGLNYGLRKLPLLTVAEVDGSLLTGFSLHKIRYVTEYEELEVAAVHLTLTPQCLLRRTICIETLAIQDFDWHTLRSRESSDFDFPAITLPPLHFPVNVEIADASMNRLTLYSQHSHFDIRDARVRLHTDNDTLFLSEVRTDLVFSALTIRAALEGSLDVRGETSANLSARVGLDFTGDVPNLNIAGEIRGSGFAPELSVTTQGLVDAQAELRASFREKGWPVYARVKQNAPIQLAETVPVKLSDTVAIISGYVNAYHVEGQTQVSGIPRTPTVTAGVITDGGFFGLSKGAVNLRIGQQEADVRGEFTWYPKLYWKTDVDFSNLDAATWLEGATSNLSGSAQVTGEWYPHIPFRNEVQNLTASGQWRSHAVSLATQFTTTAAALTIDHLDASLGRNRASVKGGVDQQWGMAGEFNLPALTEVLPQLDGAIEGKFTLQGPRATPAVQMSASSPQLRVYDVLLDKVTASLNGTPQQHTLAASAQWQGYAAHGAVQGHLEKTRWQGQLHTLDLARENKRFTLQKPAALAYELEKNKIDLDTVCLQSGAEQACAKTAWHFAKGQGALEITVKEFDAALMTQLLTTVDIEPGRWTGNARASFNRYRPINADWELMASPVKLKRVGDKRFSPVLNARNVQLKGKLSKYQLENKTTLTWEKSGSTEAVISFADINKPSSFSIALDTSPLPVSWAAPWVTKLRLQSGTLAGKFAGTVMDGWPSLRGELELQAGKLSTSDKSWGLEQLDSHLELQGESATLTGNARDDRGLEWELSTPVIASWRAQDQRINLQQACLSTGSSTLCVKGHYSLESGVDLVANAQGNISPWLAPVLTDNALIDGPFEGNARLTQQNGKLVGNLQLRSTIASTLPTTDGTPPPSMRVSINGDLANDTLLATLSLQGAKRSRVDGRLKVEIAGTKAIDGHINIAQVDIAPLKPLVREFEQLAGEINGMFLISGTLKHPTLEGQLELVDGKFTSAIYPLAFSPVTAKATFTQQNAQLVAQLESGKRGKAKLTSRARWDTGQLVTESRLVSQQIPIKQGSNINLRVDTDLTLASSDGRIDLGGLIHVKEGFLRVAKLPENSTNISKDVVFIDERGALESEGGVDAHINLAVQLSDLVQLDGLGAQVRMAGAVGIQQTPPNDPIGRGSLTITEGTYTGYGQKLKITKGQILFNGPLDNPVLAIKAVREANNVDGGSVVAGINISGTPQQPESTLFSVPAMPEQDILYYIVTGRSRQAQRSADQFAMNQALLSVGLYGSEDFTRELASKVGIDDFEISTSTDNDDNNSVNVGGYLSPKLFVQYGVGINTPVNTLTLRYRLTQSIFLEALSGAESALDVLYSFEVE